MRPTLVVFLKQPRPGIAKSRLARDVGRIEAAWWFRHQSAALLRRLAPDHRWHTMLAVTPDAGCLRSRAWPPGSATGLPRAGQGAGDLGRRMIRFLRREPGTGVPPGPVAVIGADLPDLRPHHVAAAFRLLGRHDAVLGPATDGGYWLIGLGGSRRVPRDLLDGVRWSTGHALADTVARLEGVASLSIGYAATLRDVDRGADLARRHP